MKYFAYGSNLNLSQLQNRCPSARFQVLATLQGYTLEFRGRAKDAKATICIAEKGVVMGAIFDLSAADVKALDQFEGVAGGSYKKLSLVVSDFDGHPVQAFTYVMARRGKGLPSEEYYRKIEEGYRDCGLPFGPLQAALEGKKPAKRSFHEDSFYDVSSYDRYDTWKDLINAA